VATNKRITETVVDVTLVIVAAGQTGTSVIGWARAAVRISWNVKASSQLIATTVVHLALVDVKTNCGTGTGVAGWARAARIGSGGIVAV